MSPETISNIQVAFALAVFLVIAYFIGGLINRFKFARFDQAWTPLVPMIEGTITHEAGGAATSWLTGTYQGRKVRASMTPGRNRYSSGNGGSGRYNYFDLELLDLPGAHDWKIAYRQALLSFGKPEWNIETQDKSLKERLERADVISKIVRMGDPTVSYREAQSTLSYSEEVTPRWAPSPERFQEELELLLFLANLNEELNPRH